MTKGLSLPGIRVTFGVALQLGKTALLRGLRAFREKQGANSKRA
jgi:hypothetical protein